MKKIKLQLLEALLFAIERYGDPALRAVCKPIINALVQLIDQEDTWQ